MEILKENLLLITDSVNDLICVLDQNFEIEFINEQVYLNLLGYSKEELVGKNVETFIEDKSFKELRKILKNYDETEKSQLEIQFLHKNGNYFWFMGKLTLFREYHDKNKILLIMKDISKRKEIELTLKECSSSAAAVEIRLMMGNVSLSNTSSAKTPMTTAKALEEIGFNVVVYPGSALYAAAWAIENVMKELKNNGTTKGYMDRMYHFHDFNKLMDVERFLEQESSYLKSLL